MSITRRLECDFCARYCRRQPMNGKAIIITTMVIKVNYLHTMTAALQEH